MIRFADHPGWFWPLLILWLPSIIVIMVWSWRQRHRILSRLGNPELIQQLSSSVSRIRRRTKEMLRLGALAALLLAAAGPRFSTELTEVTRKGVDIVVLLDVSNSMLAEDITPNRLEKAKFELRRLLKELRGDRVALVVFAGQAHLQTPLTLDYAAFEMFLDIADERLIGVQGTSLESALLTGLRAFPEDEDKFKTMILISDGEDHEGNLENVLEQAQAANVVIHTAGVGGFAGTPIPILDERGEVTGYRKTKTGDVVTTRLTTKSLEAISLATDGRFVHLASAGSSLDEIYSDILGMEQKEFTRHEFTNFKEQYAWFAVIALVLLLIDFILSDKQPVDRRMEMTGTLEDREHD